LYNHAGQTRRIGGEPLLQGRDVEQAAGREIGKCLGQLSLAAAVMGEGEQWLLIQIVALHTAASDRHSPRGGP
jgi:hypothetical protein